MILLVPNLTEMLFSDNTRTELYIYSAIGVILGYFTISTFAPRKEILEITNTSRNVKLHSWMLFFYVVISFISLMIIIVSKRKIF